MLRGFALAGNVLLALIAVGIVLSGQRGAPIFVFAASVVLLSCMSFAALASRVMRRPIFWSAMLLNGLAVVLFGFIAGMARSSGVLTALIFIIPAVLNLTAIQQRNLSASAPSQSPR